MSEGWICARCGQSNAPFMPVCGNSQCRSGLGVTISTNSEGGCYACIHPNSNVAHDHPTGPNITIAEGSAG